MVSKLPHVPPWKLNIAIIYNSILHLITLFVALWPLQSLKYHCHNTWHSNLQRKCTICVIVERVTPSGGDLVGWLEDYHIQLWRCASLCNEFHQDIGSPNSLYNFRRPSDALSFNSFEGAIIIVFILLLSSLSNSTTMLIAQLWALYINNNKLELLHDHKKILKNDDIKLTLSF